MRGAGPETPKDHQAQPGGVAGSPDVSAPPSEGTRSSRQEKLPAVGLTRPRQKVPEHALVCARSGGVRHVGGGAAEVPETGASGDLRMSPWGPWCETTGNPRKMPPGARGCCALWGRGARPAPGGSCTEGLCAPDAREGQANLKKSRRKREPGLVEGDGASRRLERQPRSGTSLSVNRTAANARLSKDAGKRGARAAGPGREG